MDNTSTSPQIVFPNVPDDFCPTGNWTEVFQQLIDVVLSNGTINVPGLGDVTPAQIQEINNELDTLDNRTSALETNYTALEARVDDLEAEVVTVRTGTVTIAAGGPNTYNVTFAAVPDANYGVIIQPIGTATTAAAGKYILQAGQTTTGFTILVNDNPATVTELRWTAIHTS